jgi:hypothetical protein
VNKNDEADNDDDDDGSDLSVVDIDSEIQSTDEEVEKQEQVVFIKKSAINKRESHQPIESTTPCKRRRVQSQQPKRQRANKPIEVPKDENGNYIFPVQLGRSLLLSLGNIIPNENFYNQNYIFPVGYSIQRLVINRAECLNWESSMLKRKLVNRSYKSMVNEDAFTNYTCSIDKDAFDKPIVSND